MTEAEARKDRKREKKEKGECTHLDSFAPLDFVLMAEYLVRLALLEVLGETQEEQSEGVGQALGVLSHHRGQAQLKGE